MVDGKKQAMSDRTRATRREERRATSNERRATSDLPLPPPEGDTSEEVVGNGSQPFRRVDERREGKSNEQPTHSAKQRATSNEQRVTSDPTPCTPASGGEE